MARMAWKPLWRGGLYGSEAFIEQKEALEAFMAQKLLWYRSLMVWKLFWIEVFMAQKLSWHEVFSRDSSAVCEAVSLCWGIRSEASFAIFHVGGNLDALYSWWTVRTTARALACNSRPKWPIVLRS